MIKNPYKLRQKLKVVGKTIDDKVVLKNCFIFLSTLGIPFDLIVENLYENGFVIDWIDFCQAAKNDGWNKNTLLNKIKDGISIFDDEYQTELMKRINIIMEKLYEYC